MRCVSRYITWNEVPVSECELSAGLHSDVWGLEKYYMHDKVC